MIAVNRFKLVMFFKIKMIPLTVDFEFYETRGTPTVIVIAISENKNHE